MDQFTQEFAPAAASVSEARRFVRGALEGWSVELAYDASLLVSELATNAVIHAQTGYRVTVILRSGVVRVEVADSSRVAARRCHYGETSATGRGLGMVEELSSTWGVKTRDAGKTIWFELTREAGALRETTAFVDADRALDGDLDAIIAELGGWDDAGESGAKAMRQLVCR